MNTHTPGPWTAEPNGGDDSDMRRLYICADMGAMTTVAEAYSGVDHGDAEANARLIAEAPNLLAALKHVVRDLEAIADNTNDGRVPLLARMSAHNARAAIAKAEGTS